MVSGDPSKQITKTNENPTLLHVRALCLSIITPSLTMQCRRYDDCSHFKAEETALQLHPRSWIGQDPQRNQFPEATIGGRQGQLPWTTFWERSWENPVLSLLIQEPSVSLMEEPQKESFELGINGARAAEAG